MANGVFGCAVIGIVILASLGVAFLGNADERQVDTTDWNYVTSANPAFTYDNAPARVDYSPPANITGYTTSSAKSEYISGVTYTATSTPNSYMVKTAPTRAASGSVTYQELINNSLGYISSLNTVSFTYNHVWNKEVSGGYYSPAAISPLTNIFTSLEGAESLTISASSIITLTPGDNDIYFIASTNDTPAFVAGSDRYYEYSSYADKAVISTVGSTAQLYDGNELLGTYSLANIRLVSAINFQPPGFTPDVLALSLDYTVDSWTAGYMNPNNGVTIKTDVAAYSDLSHVAAGDTVYSGAVLDGDEVLDYAFSLGDSGPYNQTIYLNVYKGSTITVTRGEYPDPNSPANYVIEDYTTTLNTAGNTTIQLHVTDDEILAEWADFRIVVTVVDETYNNTVYWFNGYDNAAVDLLVKSFEGSVEISGVTVACASSSWTVGGVAVGTWPAVLITFDMDAGVSVRPVSTMINFMSYELVNDTVQINTTATAAIGSLTFSRDVAVNLAVVSTVVYLEGGGVYRVDSYLDVSAKFPNYTTYNVTINGAPHWGDSITINGLTCAVDKAAGTVEISGATFPLSGLVLAYSDSTFYYKGNVYDAGHLVAINDGLAVDLGAVAGLVLQFDGTWYYETALYSGAPGTVTVVDWTPGVLGLDASAFAAVFTLLALVGLVLASRLGGGTWDYLVLGSAVLVGFIMCGVFI